MAVAVSVSVIDRSDKRVHLTTWLPKTANLATIELLEKILSDQITRNAHKQGLQRNTDGPEPDLLESLHP